MTEAVITLQTVSKSWKTGGRELNILREVDLQVTEGEFVALFGPSGSGKSTLLHLLAGLVSPDSGDITVCGQDLRRTSEERVLELRRRIIGYVFQDFRLLQGLTALENVMVPLLANGVRRRPATARAEETLAELGLQDRVTHYPRQLSGGEQQRVAIARALANRPRLILADEPTGNLDEENALEIMRLLQRLPQENGTTIIAVSHNPQFAEFTSRNLRLRQGKLEEFYR